MEKYLRLTYLITARAHGAKIYATSDPSDERYSVLDSNNVLTLFKPKELNVVGVSKDDTYAAYTYKDIKLLAIANRQKLDKAILDEKRGSNEIVNYLVCNIDQLDVNIADVIQFDKIDRKFRKIEYTGVRETNENDRIPLDSNKINRLSYDVERIIDSIDFNTVVNIYNAIKNGENLSIVYDEKDYQKYVDTFFSTLKLLPIRLANKVSFVTRYTDEVKQILSSDSFILGSSKDSQERPVGFKEIEFGESATAVDEFSQFLLEKDLERIKRLLQSIKHGDLGDIDSFDELNEYIKQFINMLRITGYSFTKETIALDLEMLQNGAEIDDYNFDISEYKKQATKFLIDNKLDSILAHYSRFLLEQEDVSENFDYLIKLYGQNKDADLKERLQVILADNSNYEKIGNLNDNICLVCEVLYDVDSRNESFNDYVKASESQIDKIDTLEELNLFYYYYQINESNEEGIRNFLSAIGSNNVGNQDYLIAIFEDIFAEKSYVINFDNNCVIASYLNNLYQNDSATVEKLLTMALNSKEGLTRSFVANCGAAFDGIISKITSAGKDRFIDARYNKFATTVDFIQLYHFAENVADNNYLLNYIGTKFAQVKKSGKYSRVTDSVSRELIESIDEKISNGYGCLQKFKEEIEQANREKGSIDIVKNFDDMKNSILIKKSKFNIHKRPYGYLIAQLIVMVIVVMAMFGLGIALSFYAKYGQIRLRLWAPAVIAVLYLGYSFSLRRFFYSEYRALKFRLNICFTLLAIVLMLLTFVLSIF